MLVQPSLARLITPSWASRTPSPLHDALDPMTRATILATNRDSWLHVSRRADDQVGVKPQFVAEESAAALVRLIEEGAYSTTEEPTFFLYQYSEEGHQQTGLVASIPIEAFIDGRVVGHEHVEPHRVRALVKHQEKLSMRGDLVALLFPDSQELADLLTPVTSSKPEVDIPGELSHRIWRLATSTNSEISSAFDSLKLYLIDGHHRVAAAIEEWTSLGKPQGFSVLCLLTPQSQLRSLSFDRRVVGPIMSSEWLTELGAVEVDDQFRKRDFICVYFDERWWSVELTDCATGVAALDVIRLHDQILRPHFGIYDFTSLLLEVTSQRLESDVLRYRCDNDGGAAFIIWPPSVSEIMAVADRGEQLPPKSSYFDPKPWSGVLVCKPLASS